MSTAICGKEDERDVLCRSVIGLSCSSSHPTSLYCFLSVPEISHLYSLFFSVHLYFQQVRANLARLRSCVEELRSIPGEGCIRGAARGGELLRQAVLDSLQQFKQYIRHTCTGNQASNNAFVEVSRDRPFICTTSTTNVFIKM